jgi:sirohydrochlorin ferrochelatase
MVTIPPAILLIAHGSRRAQANLELEQIAAQLHLRGNFCWVQPAYLELAEPSIDEGAARCVERRASVVIMLPYFLSLGRHVVDDLTAARDRLRQRYPQVTFLIAPPLGQHPALVDILLQHAQLAERELAGS